MDTSTWQRIKQLFNEVQTLAPQNQLDALRKLESDATIIEEVKNLLRADKEQLADGTLGFNTHISSCLSEWYFKGETLEPGTQVGIYKIVELIGSGGSNFVYLAVRADKKFKQQVAIKIARFEASHQHWSTQSTFEQQALGRLMHPNIARIFDAGTTADGYAFIVMEYIAGTDLLTYCNEHRLTINQRIALLRKVCLGLQYAHQQGIVHKDIKPGNILVESVDGDAIPKIIDFGIAQITQAKIGNIGNSIGQSNPDSINATEQVDNLIEKSPLLATMRMGTPNYMSPEQIESPAESDARNDIYAIGIVMYHLLCDYLPVQGQTLSAAELLELKQQAIPTLRHQFKSLSGEEQITVAKRRRISPRQLSRALGVELDAIIAKATAYDINSRYPSSIEFAQELHRFIQNKPIFAMPNSRFYWFKKLFLRNWLAFSAGIGFTCSAIIATIFIFQALLSENLAHEQTKRINQFLIELFSQADPSINKGEEQSLDAVIEKATKKLLSDKSLETRYRIPMLQRLGAVFSELGKYQRAAEVFAAALKEQMSWRPNDWKTIAQLHVDYGNVLTYAHQYNHAEIQYKKALALLDDRDADVIACSAYSQYANLNRYMGNFSQGLNNVEIALPLCAGSSPLQHLFTNETKAYILDELGKPHDAIQVLKNGLLATEQRLGADNPHHIMGLPSLASMYLSIGKLEEAKTTAQQGLQLARKVFGEQHEKTAHIHNMLANTHHDLGEFLSAAEHYSAAEAFYREHNPENLEFAFVINNRAALLADREDYAGALPLYEESLILRKALLPEKHYHIGNAYLNLARTHRRLNNPQNASLFLDLALGIYQTDDPIKSQLDKVIMEKALQAATNQQAEVAQALLDKYDIGKPKSPYALGKYYISLAQIAALQKDKALALKNYILARDTFKQTLHSNHPLIHYVSVQIAAIYIEQGKTKAARVPLLSALPILNKHLHRDSPTLALLNELAAATQSD